MSKEVDNNRREERLLDPFLNLSLPSPARSLCFVGNRGTNKVGKHYLIASSDDVESDDDSSDSSSDSNSSSKSSNSGDSHDELAFRSSALQNRADAPSQARQFRRRQDLLTNRVVVSCHANGEAILWDCGRQRQISTIVRNNQKEGSGMAVKRIDPDDDTEDCSQFLYQTRDTQGTVSIHSLVDPSSVIREYETYSATFCQAAPCRGNSHLVALPSRDERTATVMDDRDPVPVFVTTGARGSSATKNQHNYGMLTSLAMTMTGTGGRPILACGMENGSVIFYDFAAGRTSSKHDNIKGECPLSKDPVLALDLAPSESATLSSVVAVAGLAGDALEVAELPEAEQGRVVVIKASINTRTGDSTTPASAGNNDNPTGSIGTSNWYIRQRTRLSTCRVGGEETFVGGKPGVAICRFRPDDGRVLAVGGWDHRVRLFDRARSSNRSRYCRPLGILRGHTGSVNALDWAPDASISGLLATAGGEDGRILFWECFPKNR